MPAGHLNLKPKKSGETCFGSQPFDFTASLAGNETILSAAVTALVYSGIDSNPSAIVSGSATISGSQVTQLFAAGVVGVIYEVLCSITTSLGQTLKQSAFLAIIPDLT